MKTPMVTTTLKVPVNLLDTMKKESFQQSMKTKEYVSWQELVRDILVEEFMNDKHKAKGK